MLIWGPRQCGKSTFVAHELPHFEHFDLERPADFNLISSDPEMFFMDHGEGICIDEAQRYPDLFPVLRHIIDRRRSSGRFVLLGSSGPLLLRVLLRSKSVWHQDYRLQIQNDDDDAPENNSGSSESVFCTDPALRRYSIPGGNPDHPFLSQKSHLRISRPDAAGKIASVRSELSMPL